MTSTIPPAFTPLLPALLELPFPVSLTDHEDHYVFINPAFERVYGYTLADLLGRGPGVLTPRSTLVNETFLKKLHADTRAGGWRGRLVNATRKGKRFRIDLHTLMLTPDGIAQNTVPSSAPTPAPSDTVFLGVACEAGAEEQRDRLLLEQLLNRFIIQTAAPTLNTTLLAQQPPRRKEIYKLFKEGCSYKEIAWHLHISDATVRVAMSELRKQMGEDLVPRLRRDKPKQT